MFHSEYLRLSWIIYKQKLFIVWCVQVCRRLKDYISNDILGVHIIVTETLCLENKIVRRNHKIRAI